MDIKDVKLLKVAALHYAVERRPPPITEGENLNVTGRVVYDSTKLLIADNLSPEVETHTILHEVMHAMFSAAGMRHHDEQLIETFGQYLFDFVRDNPEFINAIQSFTHKS